MLQEVGADVYKSWSDEQRHEEIAKLVQGYKTGLPLEILCMVATSIAGTPVKAKKHLRSLLTAKERKLALKNLSGSEESIALVKSYLA